MNIILTTKETENENPETIHFILSDVYVLSDKFIHELISKSVPEHIVQSEHINIVISYVDKSNIKKRCEGSIDYGSFVINQITITTLKSVIVKKGVWNKHWKLIDGSKKVTDILKTPNMTCFYEGCFSVDGLRHGKGVFKSENGHIQEGNWNMGKIHGHGKTIYSNGTTIEGDYVSGIINFGKCKYSNGTIYEGEFNKKLKRHGKGVFTDKFGEIFDGYFINGVFNGFGTCTTTKGESRKGHFVGGELNGHGEFKSLQGYTYKGNFEKTIFHGHGIYKYPAGDVFEGEFEDGNFKLGILYCRGGAIYEGGFDDKDNYSGIGIYIRTNDDIYRGYWKSGHKHGVFTMINNKTGKSYIQKWNKGKLRCNKRKKIPGYDALLKKLKQLKSKRVKRRRCCKLCNKRCKTYCGKCKRPYCGRSCQVKDWKNGHKNKCKLV